MLWSLFYIIYYIKLLILYGNFVQYYFPSKKRGIPSKKRGIPSKEPPLFFSSLEEEYFKKILHFKNTSHSIINIDIY